MAELTGIRGMKPRTPLVLVPYAAAGAETGPPTRADPFFDGSSAFGSVGLDLRRKVGSSFALDATVNPDFGQVEADPAVVNLTAFETFFPEKRPFFVEGARIFDTSAATAEQLLRLHAHRARALLLAAHRPRARRATADREYAVRTSRPHDHPRRREAHGQHGGGLVASDSSRP